MIENIEMLPETKKDLKRIALEKNITMRELITQAVLEVIDEDDPVPETQKSENFTSLTINISRENKDKIRKYVYYHDCKYRDIWHAAANRVIENNRELV